MKSLLAAVTLSALSLLTPNAFAQDGTLDTATAIARQGNFAIEQIRMHARLELIREFGRLSEGAVQHPAVYVAPLKRPDTDGERAS